MRKRYATPALVATGVALCLGLSACGGGGGGGQSADSGGAAGQGDAAGFNAALEKVVNPSDKKGGTLKMAITEAWDSIDPGDTYYALSWNFSRIYGRPLVTYNPAPGAEGRKLVPDLAESLGEASDGGKTWTYKIRPGVKFEDGTIITSKDVKYAVLRQLDKDTFVNGPTYFGDYLDLPKDFKSVYKTPDVNTDSAIETPDDQTIVFHLKKPYAGFDNFAATPATVPVPKDKDSGIKYRQHPIASGPYMFEKVEEGKQYTLVRNPNWDPATDPIRKALPDRYELQLGVEANDLDNRIMSGDLHIDLAGTGVQAAATATVQNDPELKARADNPTAARTWYISLLSDTPPFDNVECRKAVIYAADRVGLQNAYGGQLAGEIASGLMPPSIGGWQKLDLYPTGTGDVAKAKEALAACGKPDGFETTMTFRSDRPKEQAAAESMQQALAKAGIKLTLKGFPTSEYFPSYAGKPAYTKKNNIGIATNGWAADWNDGFGFFSQIVDSRVIREAGNYNLGVKSPEIDALIDKANLEQDAATRDAIWGEVDRKVMEGAYVLPAVWAKGLTLRGKGLTNVFVTGAYDMYDYLNLGVE
ncbi:ABC transporter substrate-binding protein [Sphaerimonospora thailandensis]|uniref:Peptide ABC transporter substrate-binding protein n=1 Tax=Sphaerimonospora thailandensis TaxID=795644 RepID=A0A8J3VZW6_9ACTN|nr:ABC transporter substrate-binding protein [Sphaerimonospora thailandensis]GIH71614.1 peptide ABC transporter substrate-binding protein [Sphaerimonospora thailandensis]